MTAVAPTTACVSHPAVFLAPLLEEPLPSSAPAATRRRHSELVAAASAACGQCPLAAKCLYDAVVNHDVSGFVAGTTAKEREQIRTRLGVKVQAEDMDVLAGVFSSNRQVNHEQVLRLRQANPDESLETIAQRLGCSLSTVKRHLRKARTAPKKPTLRVAKPSMSQVLEVAAEMKGSVSRAA